MSRDAARPARGRAAPGAPAASSSVTHVSRLVDGRVLARNVLLNGTSWIVPALLALAAVPVLVRRLGEARFGVLTLAWTLVGYFSLFDLGLGRALTQLVSERIGSARQAEVPRLVWSALWLLVPLGVVGSVVTAALAPWLTRRVLHVAPALEAETVTAFALLAVAIPFTVMTAGLRGVLEAVQAFGRIAVLRVPLALATFGGPLVVVALRPSLVGCVAVLAAGRAVVCALHVRAVRAAFPELGAARRPGRAELRALAASGGWMTVSNVVSPIMTSLDRFVVGAVLSLAAVAHYATAYEAVTRLWVIPTVLLSVLFPALAVSAAAEPARAARLFDRGARATLLAVVPCALALSAFAPEWLTVWVGPDVAAHATPLAQGLAAAVLVNVAGQLAYALVQAVGRADVTGRLHLAECVPYAITLWLLLREYGAPGVVMAWGLRVTIDTAALLFAARRLLPEAGGAINRVAVLTVVMAPAALAPLVLSSLAARGATFAVAFGAFGLYAWRALAGPDERAALTRALARRRPALAPEG